jgi:hypothetical protein
MRFSYIPARESADRADARLYLFTPVARLLPPLLDRFEVWAEVGYGMAQVETAGKSDGGAGGTAAMGLALRLRWLRVGAYARASRFWDTCGAGPEEVCVRKSPVIHSGAHSVGLTLGVVLRERR